MLNPSNSSIFKINSQESNMPVPGLLKTLFYTHRAIWHDLGYKASKYEFGTFLYKSTCFI